MLIDDSIPINFFHKRLIEKLGMSQQIMTAENGEDALQQLKGNELHPDLVLLDINMPLINGWEFLEAYHQQHNKPGFSAKVIMLSTSPSEEDRHKAESIPEVFAYYTKPLSIDILKEIWERVS
jgi:CheY-like chemotaxis protein